MDLFCDFFLRETILQVGSERHRRTAVDRADGAPGGAAAVVAGRGRPGGRRRRRREAGRRWRRWRPPEALLLRPVQLVHHHRVDVVLVHHHQPARHGDARHHQRPRLPALRLHRLLKASIIHHR